MTHSADTLTALSQTCKHEIQATWAQKIRAIRLAALSVAEEKRAQAVFLVTHRLSVGEEHMTYKDFKEFNCSCEEEYIFGEAAHLIEEANLPFNEALNRVLREDCCAAGGKGACVDLAERYDTVADMAKQENIVETVKQLCHSLEQIDEALSWANSQEEAEPLNVQRRILNATLTAIKAEYSSGYFD